MLSEKLEEFKLRRSVSADLPRGISPMISSSLFQASSTKDDRRKSKDWHHHLSDESRKRKAATLKATASAVQSTPQINLGVARPNATYFPWTSLSMEALSCTNHHHSDYKDHEPKITSLMSCTTTEPEYNLSIALNYGYSTGSPHFLRFITEHIELIHNPQIPDWECTLTSGTTSALEILLRMLCNPGASILAESHTYPGFIEATKPLALNLIPIPMDRSGLLPSALEHILSSWEPSSSGPKPHVLYTIPSGQNPTGTTQTPERRRQIHALAEKHDLIILEDDPYHFLQLDLLPSSSAEEYLRLLPASYLSLDPSGRVLRLDSASKILAPGLRCGWLTGCATLVEKFRQHVELSSVAVGGPAQVMLRELLDGNWGHEGFLEWLMGLSSRYGKARDTVLEACERHLPEGVCRWEKPGVGMFVWVWVDLGKVSGRKGRGTEDADYLVEIEDAVFREARRRGVQIGKGSWFEVVGSGGEPELAFRLTTAAVLGDELAEGVRRFGDALRKVLGGLSDTIRADVI